VVALIDSVMSFLGQPIVAGQMTNRGALHQVLDEVGQSLTKETVDQVMEMAGSFLENPGVRLTGTELALNEVTQRVRALVTQLEARLPDSRRGCLGSYNRLLGYSDALDAANWALRRNSITRELVTGLRAHSPFQFD